MQVPGEADLLLVQRQGLAVLGQADGFQVSGDLARHGDDDQFVPQVPPVHVEHRHVPAAVPGVKGGQDGRPHRVR